MTSKQHKIVYAVAIAGVGLLTDVGAQWSAGTINVTRSVVVGVVLGGVARLIGAALSILAVDDRPSESKPNP